MKCICQRILHFLELHPLPTCYYNLFWNVTHAFLSKVSAIRILQTYIGTHHIFSIAWTQLLKQFVEYRKMQTIHLEGKVPTFTVICLSASSSWAAEWPKKERRKQMWRENYFSYQRNLFTRSSWATQRPDRDWSSRTLPTSPRTPTLPPEGWDENTFIR